jgi:hypothetical protein
MRVVAKRTRSKRTHFENPMRGSRDQSATTRSSIARAKLSWEDDETTRPHATRSSEQPRRRRNRSDLYHLGGRRTAEYGGCEEGTSTILEETTKTTVVKHRTPANTGRSGKGSTSRAKQPETVGKGRGGQRTKANESKPEALLRRLAETAFCGGNFVESTP